MRPLLNTDHLYYLHPSHLAPPPLHLGHADSGSDGSSGPGDSIAGDDNPARSSPPVVM